MALRTTMLAGLLALLMGAPAPTLAGEPVADQAIGEARTSALEWLALLDAREWGQAWKEAGELLQAAVSQDEWAQKMSVTLGPLGPVSSRRTRSSAYSTTMPGAPDGEYVVVQFDTTFENKQTALENVVMRKQSDGSWRVAGYRIR